MSTLANKQRILDDGGYDFSIARGSYINRDARKLISIQFIDSHDEADLEACVQEPWPTSNGWRFYFNSPPSESMKQQLSKLLD